MDKRDFYDVLGVSQDADDKALKSAFRKLAMEYHPDRNAGDQEAERKFKEINEAYDALKDPQSRAAYDRFGHAAFENGSPGGGAAGFGSDFSSSMSDIFDDLFSEFMGGGQRRGPRGQERGSDLRYNLEITLEEAFSGKTAEIVVPSSVTCDECTGSGAKPGSEPSTCPTCQGRGKVTAAQGFFRIERTCPSCHGLGQIIQNPCEKCSGTGRSTKNRTLSVNIPGGVEDGTRIRLAGEGEAGLRGGGSGDLYVFLSITPHDFFHRDGPDLFCQVPLSMTTAALGGEIEVPVIDGGRARVKIPEGTQAGNQFRVRGKGMPVLRAGRVGDLYIQVSVETPVQLSRKQRQLLKEFDDLSNKKTNPNSAGFMARAKDFWNSFS